MARPTTLKDHFRETRIFTNRAIVALVLSILLMLVLVARLVNLQIIEHKTYTVLSDKNRMHISAVPPTRGLIFDRNGLLLAENLSSYSLELVPERVKDLDTTLTELGKLIRLDDEDLERFRKRLASTRNFNAIPLRSRLSDEEVASFAVNRYRFPGVDIAARLYRHYPYGSLMVHALGYVGRINEAELQQIDTSNYEGTEYIGKTGVEKFYEDILHGEVGVQQLETNAQGRTVRVLEQTPPVPGLSLHLTLDANMQRIADEALGDERGAVVAIDPRDGGVLAMVSKPGFDPNLFVEGISVADYAKLQHDIDKPLYNRALRGQYPPGSTVKPFIGLGGLETGTIGYKTVHFCPGYFQLPNTEHKYRDWKKAGHGAMDMDSAITQSCDVYFYELSNDMGIDKLSSFLAEFGFGARTGVDLIGELPGLLPSREWKRARKNKPWYPGETLIMGIGQGYFLTTPMQLAAATATFANGGTFYAPRIGAELVDKSTGLEEDIPSAIRVLPINNVVNWQHIAASMLHVVEGAHGTARSIATNAYHIAGKTGTAQVFSVAQEEEYEAEKVAERLRDHALFIAYAPVEAPRIAVAVIVENGGHGGSAAAPLARRIMDIYLQEQP